ncbi:MAG TPA: IPT/TIG domain-containing protein [Frankiaceae bacterium]|nr:IPT/TIG domain-containing protein [Frankiaceae bacterium]
MTAVTAVAIAAVCTGTGVASAVPVAAQPPAHGLGAVRSPGATTSPALGTRALSVVASTTTAVPASVDLSRFDPKVGDQGSVNSCSAWAIGYGMLGWFANSQGHAGAPFAPMYAYSQLTGPGDTGSSPMGVLEILRTQGIDTAAKYAPGHGGAVRAPLDWTHRPTAAEKAAAAANKITGWVTLYNTFGPPGATAVAKLKQTLAAGRPVAITIGVFSRFELAQGTGVISSAGSLGPLLGLHEVLAVGYDSRGVKIENSWGTGWGNAGYGILDWNYIAKYSYEAETAAGFVTTTSANRPTVTAVAPATGSIKGGQTVTIAGTNLANSVVSVGSQSVIATSVTADHKHLTFRAPAAAAGLDVVRVSTPSGVSPQTWLTGYRYVK